MHGNGKRTGLLCGLSLALFALAATAARADVVYLGSGGIVKGKIVKESPNEVVVKTASGETVIPREDIDRIERGGTPEEMYRERLKKVATGDAEGHYQLGLWLKRMSSKELARDEFLKTIMLDPEHKFAREELGYIRQLDRWVLPGEGPLDVAGRPVERSERVESSGKVDRVEKLDRPEKEKVEKVEEFKPDASGLSQDLSKALAGLDAKDATSRTQAWEKLGQLESSETERLQTTLLGPFSRARDHAWRALTKAVPAAEAIAAKVPATGASEAEAPALREELKPHLEAYATSFVKPNVEAVVAQLERRAAVSLDKTAKTVRVLIKDWRIDSAMKRREKALDWWVKARDEALKTIFDLKIYPDENHGRVGQPTVDEKVEKVRETWQFFDPMIQRDVAPFLKLTEPEAKQLVQKLDDARGRRSEVRSFLERRGSALQAAAGEDVEPLFDALLRYRAGDLDGADKLEAAITGAWEKELLRRVRDTRVTEWNEAFRTGKKVEKGKQPSNDEVEQVKLTNEYRIMMGRRALELEPRLVESARGHSEEMTRLGYFAHESPVGANKEPWDRMKNAGYPAAGGENISLGSEAPKATHLAWYNSSGHHRNILGREWAAMGSGKDGRHWTQNFGPAGTLRR